MFAQIQPHQMNFFISALIAMLGIILLCVGSFFAICKKAKSRFEGGNMVSMILKVYEISGVPLYWTLLPIAISIAIVVNFEIAFRGMGIMIGVVGAMGICSFPLANRFGKNWVFGLGILVLPFIFLPILAMDSSRYRPANR